MNNNRVIFASSGMLWPLSKVYAESQLQKYFNNAYWVSSLSQTPFHA